MATTKIGGLRVEDNEVGGPTEGLGICSDERGFSAVLTPSEQERLETLLRMRRVERERRQREYEASLTYSTLKA